MSPPDEPDPDWRSPAPATVKQPLSAGKQDLGAEQPALLPEERLLFQGLIAAGGMGTVVHAYDLRLQRHLAVKIPHAFVSERPDELSSFLREAIVTAQLDHPNLVPVHELLQGADGAPVGFTMKLVQGESLEQRLQALGEQRTEEPNLSFLLEALLKVCDALSFAHSRAVLHLDLKPGNIMVGTHGQVYLMDWGIAAKCVRGEDGFLRPVEPPPGMRGTPSHMAPEQMDVESGKLDERTDVYALGAVLYEVLFGQPPFPVPSVGEPSQRNPRERAVEPSSHVDVRRPPPGLVRVAMRALEHDPGARFPSVSAMKKEVERLRVGGGWFAVREIVQGDVIVREGEPGKEAYILAEGTCQVFKEVAGSARLLRTLGPGDVFGEMALLTHGLRTATVVATSPVSVWVVTRETLNRELGQHGWYGSLVKSLAHRFLEADEERTRLLAERERGGA